MTSTVHNKYPIHCERFNFYGINFYYHLVRDFTNKVKCETGLYLLSRVRGVEVVVNYNRQKIKNSNKTTTASV